MAGVTLYLNGTVVTMVPGAPAARALAVEGGGIVAVGGEDAVLRFRSGEHRVMDIAGRAVLPGFVDPHNHFAVGALEAFWADCRTPPLGTIAEIQAALRAAAAARPPGPAGRRDRPRPGRRAHRPPLRAGDGGRRARLPRGLGAPLRRDRRGGPPAPRGAPAHPPAGPPAPPRD